MINEVWSVGRTGCVVSNTPQRPSDDHDDRSYYGGYCVAESIMSAEKAQVLAASLDLLAASKRAAEWLAGLAIMQPLNGFDGVFESLRAAIDKAEAPIPFMPPKRTAADESGRCPDCGAQLTDRTTLDGKPSYCDVCDCEVSEVHP